VLRSDVLRDPIEHWLGKGHRMTQQPLHVMFLCTGNSARSQLAEVILRHLSQGRINVASAGSAPQADIHPLARIAARKLLRVEMEGQQPKLLDPFLGQSFDYIITVCDRAAEICPTFPGDPQRIHWSFPDPAAVQGSEEERQRAFDNVARELLNRIRLWMALPAIQETFKQPNLA
jgi:protein-tyrosine-phosphatase